jgi:hypothetical protein
MPQFSKSKSKKIQNSLIDQWLANQKEGINQDDLPESSIRHLEWKSERKISPGNFHCSYATSPILILIFRHKRVFNESTNTQQRDGKKIIIMIKKTEIMLVRNPFFSFFF